VGNIKIIDPTKPNNSEENMQYGNSYNKLKAAIVENQNY
jgi:hypothetical protein